MILALVARTPKRSSNPVPSAMTKLLGLTNPLSLTKRTSDLDHQCHLRPSVCHPIQKPQLAVSLAMAVQVTTSMDIRCYNMEAIRTILRSTANFKFKSRLNIPGPNHVLYWHGDLQTQSPPNRRHVRVRVFCQSRWLLVVWTRWMLQHRLGVSALT